MASKSDLPSFDKYFVPTVAVLKQHGGSATIEELEEWVANAMNLSEELRGVPHGDGPRSQFQYELAWVRTYLKKVLAAENSERGVWRLTQKGQHLSDDEISRIPQMVRNLEKEQRKKENKQKLEEPAPLASTDDEEEEIENWKEGLLECLLSMSPPAFERLCQRVLRESGFIKVEVTGKSGDGGIDGIGVLRFNLLSFQVFFQCKRWKGSVGSSTVRDFRGAMVGRADKGLVITTGNFTAEARKETTRDGAPAIDLVDGEALCELLKKLEIGVATEKVERVLVKKEFFADV